MDTGFPQYSIILSGLVLLGITAVLKVIQNSLLIFGKYRAHIWLVDFDSHRDRFQDYSNKYWDYFFSITVLTFSFQVFTFIFNFDIAKKIIPAAVIIPLTKYFSECYIRIVLAFPIVFLFQLIFGEIIPDIISRRKTSYVLSSFHSFISITNKILKPANFLLQKIIDPLLRLFGVAYKNHSLSLDDGDVKSLFKAAANQGVLKKQEFDMITNIFELKDTKVKKTMIPAMDVTAASVSISFDELIALFKSSGYSRLPVYESTRDNIIGVVHAKQVLSYVSQNSADKPTIKNFIKNIIYVPESKELNSLLREFQKNKVHIAAVVDEFGVFSGIITIEDILEEIVGEIEDEFDEEEQQILKISENEYLIDAKINVEELNEKLKLDLPVSSDYESIGGFLIYILDDIPALHQEIEYKNYSFTIQSITRNRILKIKLEI